MLSTIVGHAVALSATSGGIIYEYDEAKQEFHLRASQRMEDEAVEALERHRSGRGKAPPDKRRPPARQSRCRTFWSSVSLLPRPCGRFSPGSAIDLFWRCHCFAKEGSWAR